MSQPQFVLCGPAPALLVASGVSMVCLRRSARRSDSQTVTRGHAACCACPGAADAAAPDGRVTRAQSKSHPYHT